MVNTKNLEFSASKLLKGIYSHEMCEKPNNLTFDTFFFPSNRTILIDVLLVFFFIQTFLSLFVKIRGVARIFNLGGQAMYS